MIYSSISVVTNALQALLAYLNGETGKTNLTCVAGSSYILFILDTSSSIDKSVPLEMAIATPGNVEIYIHTFYLLVLS